MNIHRCRFVPYTPSAINALAFSQSHGRSSDLRLAVGRANGNIELWNPLNGNWQHERTLWGGRDRSIEGLAWTNEYDEGSSNQPRNRLFSIGYNDAIVEWDLRTGKPKRQTVVSEVWCIAAQPQSRRPSKKRKRDSTNSNSPAEEQAKQLIAAGCGDGSIMLLSSEDDDLVFQKYLTRPTKKRVRVLSITWQDRHRVVASFADGVVRVYDVRPGQPHGSRTMSVGAGVRGGPKEVLVWAVECLKDGTIVAGDSVGDVTFWDGRNYTQTQKIRGHEADILCLTSSEDGRSLFSGGMDRRTVRYALEPVNGSQEKRWIKSTHRRAHDHDVKTMVHFENKTLSVVASGGKDTQLLISPLKAFNSEYHRKLPPVPQQSPISGASRRLVSWLDNEVEIWKIDEQSTAINGDMDLGDDIRYRALAKLALKSEEHITSATLSQDGRLLAVSTMAEVKLFALRPKPKAHAEALRVSKLELTPSLAHLGATNIQFSPDSRWIAVVTPASDIYIARVLETDSDSESLPVQETITKLRRTPRKHTSTSSKPDHRMITRVAFSQDSSVLAVSDIAGYIDTFILEGNFDPTAPAVDIVRPTSRGTPTDSSSSASDSDSDSSTVSGASRSTSKVIYFGQHWTRNPLTSLIPQLPTAPIVLSFRPPPPSSPFAAAAANGNPGVHPLRSKPHSHSHSRPSPSSQADELLVLTACHMLHVFSVLTGRSTTWSQRNPSSILPYEFQVQSERAIGCVWDARRRAWLYGATWLSMFDLDQDLPRPVDVDQAVWRGGPDERAERSVGREVDARTMLKSKGKRGGAGGQMRKHELTVGKVRRLGQRAAGQTAAAKVNGDASKPDNGDSEGDEEGREDEEAAVDHGSSGQARQQDMVRLADARRRLQQRGGGDNDDDDDDDDDRQRSDEEMPDADADAVVDVSAMADQEADAAAVAVAVAGKEGKEEMVGHRTRQQRSRYARRSSSPSSPPARGEPFFITSRYQPILGIVALSANGTAVGAEAAVGGNDPADPADPADSAMETAPPLEVALVERPAWDLDLPPRYFGRQEWSK